MRSRTPYPIELIGLAIALSGAIACNQTPRETSQTWAPLEPATEPRAAEPPPAACDRARVELLLSAPHDPPSAEELAAACADPIIALSELASDISARGLLRLRAIESLGELGGERSVQDLTRLATASGDLASVRRSALVALAKSTAPGNEARERVGVSRLSDPDPHVRIAAAKLLRGSPSASVRTALEQAKTREREPFVRAEIELGLASQP